MIVVLASLTLLSVQPRHASKESKTKQELAHFTPSCKILRSSSVEPDDHYPLTRTPEKWRLDAWEFEYLPFFAFAWKRSANLMMFYEGKKSMSMISWSRKGTQVN